MHHLRKLIWKQLQGHQSRFCQTKTVLKAYTGDIIPVLGACEVEVPYEENNPVILVAIITETNRPNVLGRDRLKEVKLN